MWAPRLGGALRLSVAALALCPLLLVAGTSGKSTTCTNCENGVDDEVSLLQTRSWLNYGNMYRSSLGLNTPVPLSAQYGSVPETGDTLTSGDGMGSLPMAGAMTGGLPMARTGLSMAGAMPQSFSGATSMAGAAMGTPMAPPLAGSVNMESIAGPQMDLNVATPISLAQMSQGIEQQMQMRTGSAELDRRYGQRSSEVANLQNMVQDLQRKTELQAGQLHGAIESQEQSQREVQLERQSVDFAKQQLERQSKDAQQARESEQRALRLAAQEKEDLEKLAHTQQLDRKLMQQVAEQAGVQQRQRRTLELLVLKARQSEKKAWDLAKSQAQKLQAEERAARALLVHTKTQLSDAKTEVKQVKAQVSEAFQQEVAKAKQRVNNEADVKLQKERAEVKSVVKWAQNVQKEAQDRVRWAEAAQKDAASQVTWATAAQHETANAADALQQAAQAQMKTQEAPSYQPDEGLRHPAYGFE